MIRSILVFVMFMAIVPGCSSMKPDSLGVKSGRLSPCPDSPNCVSSQSSDDDHYIAPLLFAGPVATARQKLIAAVSRMKRARIITREPSYLHVEFRTAVFRFVDDVEFLFDEKEHTIQIRSASRVGYSDLGVNRRRVEKIRDLFGKESGTLLSR